MSYLSASVELCYECPRGFSAGEHILNYHHRTNAFQNRIVCLMTGAPREIKEQYPLYSVAQFNFWKEYDLRCQQIAKEKADA